MNVLEDKVISQSGIMYSPASARLSQRTACHLINALPADRHFHVIPVSYKCRKSMEWVSWWNSLQ